MLLYQQVLRILLNMLGITNWGLVLKTVSWGVEKDYD